MRATMKSVLCLVLAVCLMAGCATGTDSSVSQPAISSLPISSVICDSSSALPESEQEIDPTQYEQYRNAEPWQLAFYEVVSNSVVAPWQLFIPQNSTPVLARISDRYAEIWRYENNMATMIYEGDANLIYYRIDNGNPVLQNYSQDGNPGNSYTELDGKNEITLCEYAWRTEIYLNAENRQLSVAEAFEFDVEDYFGLTMAQLLLTPDPGFPLATRTWKADVLYFLFGIQVDTVNSMPEYAPPVPDEAPEWVSIYMEMIHRDTFSAVSKDGKLNLFELHFPAEVILLEAAYPDGPPILDYYRFSDVGGIPFSVGYYIITDGRVEYYAYETGSEYGYQLSMDNGQAILCYTDQSRAVWYSLDESGMHKLFTSDETSIMGSYPPYYAYCDGNYIVIEEDEDISVWRGDQERQALINRGYSGNLTAPEETIYTLPEHSTWEELEAAFIDIFCTHAQKIGQWG